MHDSFSVFMFFVFTTYLCKNQRTMCVQSSLRAGSSAMDFQTESVLARNKKLKGYWNYQFFISYQLTFGLKVHCT